MKILFFTFMLQLSTVFAKKLVVKDTVGVEGFERLMDIGNGSTIYATESDIEGIEGGVEDTIFTASVDSVPYNLDILDGVYNDVYRYFPTGDNVNVYVVDTGVSEHPDFGARLMSGFSAYPDGLTADDNGHGTHVASTVGGRLYGVAKKAKIVPVKVLDRFGSGYSSTIIRGLNWIAVQKRGVVNMSLGGGPNELVERAIGVLIRMGHIVVVAAGNEGVDACTRTPARMGDVLTVACIDIREDICYFSNTGPCVDISAPGLNIIGANSKGGAKYLSGTSMSAPHVAGVVAQILQRFPNADNDMVKLTLMNISENGNTRVFRTKRGKRGNLKGGYP